MRTLSIIFWMIVLLAVDIIAALAVVYVFARVFKVDPKDLDDLGED